MQNVGMNIADKPALYREIARVLKPSGQYAFQEITSGDAPTVYFPLPWATGPDDQFLASADELQRVLSLFGFVHELFEDNSDLHMSRTAANTAAVPGQLGLGV
jgi:ubiquinone/menaquinone biosynthesis C-methylase UbiE